MKLDAYDHRILAALQRDGRLSNVQLAEEIGLSPSPCLRRVRLLGAAYLAWLGLQMLRGGGLALPTSDAGSAPVVPHADRRALLRGLLTNLLNPKARRSA